jgi:putative nucleotidyltransferase with HDIG domain
MEKKALRSVFRITAWYALFGGLWIAVSDRILETLVSDPHRITVLQTYKGWAFVAASALLIAFLVGRELRERERVERRLLREQERTRMSYDATLEGWARALELRDGVTERHTERVAEMTVSIARAMGVREEDIVHFRRGALLHDIGKIGIPDSILRKEGPLTDDEREIMKRHPVLAFDMLRPIAYLRPALDIPYCHHEQWNGNGYPRGLKGEHIPLAARIFALADIWDAILSTDRTYRGPLSRSQACEHIRGLAGTHLDPKVVDTFLSMEDRYCIAGSIGRENGVRA